MWVFDRGIVSEQNLAMLRRRGGQYLVGTPRSQLKQFERELQGVLVACLGCALWVTLKHLLHAKGSKLARGPWVGRGFFGHDWIRTNDLFRVKG